MGTHRESSRPELLFLNQIYKSKGVVFEAPFFNITKEKIKDTER